MTKGQHSVTALFLPREYLGNLRLVAFTYVECPAIQCSNPLNSAH